MTEPPSAEHLLRRALVSEDDSYLYAEHRLLDADAAAIRSAAAAMDDSLAETVARVAEWHETAPSRREALDAYLDRVERRFKPTVAGTPPIDGVVDSLLERFGAGVGDLLALRLARMPSAAPWRIEATLALLERHPSAAATAGLLRFGTTTTVPQYQAAVARVLSAGRDPGLPRKLAAERERLARTGGSLPGPLAGLGGLRT